MYKTTRYNKQLSCPVFYREDLEKMHTVLMSDLQKFLKQINITIWETKDSSEQIQSSDFSEIPDDINVVSISYSALFQMDDGVSRFFNFESGPRRAEMSLTNANTQVRGAF
jgi:hypothetical protein